MNKKLLWIESELKTFKLTEFNIELINNTQNFKD